MLWALVVAAMFASGAAGAEDIILPHERNGTFLGVETCGSSQCHGSSEAWRNATVSMKERLIWQQHDPHARAFASLTSETGNRIAHNLGLADASQARECLVCHTTFVPAAQRDAAFTLEAGVGCESCHGAGGSFLAAHVQTTSQHRSNIAAGLFPTNDANARAALCLSCHQGDNVRRITHRIYGAGHPRLRFELDTYSALQPYHFNADADYRRRKPAASHLQLWAVGQLRSATQWLTLPESSQQQSAGLFPELSRFDCHSCHRAINDDPNYQPRMGIKAGALSLNDAPLMLLRALMVVVMPQREEEFTLLTREWQTTLSDPARHAASAGKLRALVDTLGAAFARRSEAVDNRAVVAALLAQARAETPLPYGAAESTAMSLATLLTADFELQQMSPAAYQQISAALDRAFAAVQDERMYRSQEFQLALAEVATAIEQ